MNRRNRVLGAGIAVLAACGAAQADLVQFTFTGAVTSNSLTSGALVGMAVGAAVELQYIFDTGAVGVPAGPVQTRYDTASSLHLTIGTLTDYPVNQAIGIAINDGAPDRYYMANTPVFGLIWNQSLYDTTGTVFSSQALPSTLNLASFNQRQGILWTTAGPSESLTYSVDGLQVTLIPLPQTAGIGAAGLGMLWGFRRLRARALSAS